MIWKKIFFIYILMLLIFIVAKFNENINSVIATIQTNIERRGLDSGSGINLVPFKTISAYSSTLHNGIPFVNLLGNIIPFIPMGFLIPMAFPTQRNIINTMISCLLLIICIEILQLIFYLGSFDIDDILLNLLSSFIGFILFSAYKKAFKIAS